MAVILLILLIVLVQLFELTMLGCLILYKLLEKFDGGHVDDILFVDKRFFSGG